MNDLTTPQPTTLDLLEAAICALKSYAAGNSSRQLARNTIEALEEHREVLTNERTLSPSEALFGFCAWLTCRPGIVVLGAAQDAAPIVPLLTQFIDSQGLPEPRDNYNKLLKPYPADEPSEAVPELQSISIGTAFDRLKHAMETDAAYAWSWHCNLAMPIMDAGKGAISHEEANRCAAHLMSFIFGVDVTTFPEWQALVPQWAELAQQPGPDDEAIMEAVEARMTGGLGTWDATDPARVKAFREVLRVPQMVRALNLCIPAIEALFDPVDGEPARNWHAAELRAKDARRVAIAAVQGQDKDNELLQWAVNRWLAEVANRPLTNVHRRSLDDVWRQVIRHAGGDPVALVGPPHDDLVNTEAGRVAFREQAKAAKEGRSIAVKALQGQRDEKAEELYWRLHSLSKSLEGSGRIDQHDNPDAYATVLDAMLFVHGPSIPAEQENRHAE